MKVVVLHEQLAAGARADEADVLTQVAAVTSALDELGHTHEIVTATSDLEAAAAALRRARPDVVFNLVESLDGHGRTIDRVPDLLDQLGIAYTGNTGAATRDSGSKVASKRILHGKDLPTPLWLSMEQLATRPAVPACRYILKSIWEHGSLGLEDDCVLFADRAEPLLHELQQRLQRFGGSAFAEQYVHGREWNLALLADEHGTGVTHLPAAEIRFAGAGTAPVCIVGYNAKWHSGSEEDVGTPRCFATAPADAPLVANMQAIAAATWRAFGLRGYARVDFRVDADGNPWIIDVNTNPCLSPDAGFAAAVREAGLPYARAIGRIVNAARAYAP
ncbi:MAG: D-alanine--D-alanine ligase [Planctomycetes bacterium]|nr:D-alanine--D-alanine ligase [Planctomycetota bacterium]